MLLATAFLNFVTFTSFFLYTQFLEREIAMQFIKAIILASAEKGNQDPPSDPGTPSGRPTPLPLGASNRKQQSPIHHHHATMKACEVCHRQELEAALQQLQAIATMPM